jgi:DNA-binding Lrp family transcriptional regulator
MPPSSCRTVHDRSPRPATACHHPFGTRLCKAPRAQDAKDIVGITGVHQAQAVTGPYDVIVCAEARNIDELGKLVVAGVQAVDGITRTLTCPVVHL